ncbi:MAG TPA: hypothetical protein DCM86_09000 [Verrucomicrobiales bacterium]|nr:hypothetical protein [Verrucomicrobiales bacterium]
MENLDVKELEIRLRGWLEERIREQPWTSPGHEASVTVKVDRNSRNSFLAVFDDFLLDEEFLYATSDWLRSSSPDWSVTFVLCFAEDRVIVDASTIWVPLGAQSVALNDYLQLQEERVELRAWEIENFPPEKWARNSMEFDNRMAELKRLRPTRGAPPLDSRRRHRTQARAFHRSAGPHVQVRLISERLASDANYSPPIDVRFRLWAKEWARDRLQQYHPKSPAMRVEWNSTEPRRLRVECPEVSPRKELLLDIQKWLRDHAPEWIVFFETSFPEDTLRVSVSEISLPDHAAADDLETYLIELMWLRSRVEWESTHLPADQWSVSREEAIARLTR